jgi:catechol 2,3-dioxygenase-like lactoylglutathione lyase family enzyme
MPHIDGILETALYVDDLERAASFYQTLFNFELVDKGDRLYALAAGSRQILLLFKKKLSANMPRTPHDGDGRLHLAFAIPVSELDAWEARLLEHGVTIEDKRQWERGGWSLYFRDPDQHLIELATPGVWSVY